MSLVGVYPGMTCVVSPVVECKNCQSQSSKIYEATDGSAKNDGEWTALILGMERKRDAYPSREKSVKSIWGVNE